MNVFELDSYREVAHGRVSSPIDLKGLTAQLADAGAEQEIDAVLDLFEREMYRRLDQMANASARDDLEAVGDIAHSLRGASLSVFAAPLAWRLRELENLAGTGKLSLLDRQFRKVERECVSVSDYLHHLRMTGSRGVHLRPAAGWAQ